MDWSNERYIRFYTRDTAEWLALGWQARGLFGLILRVCDRAGVIELGRVGLRGLAALVHAPWSEIERPLQELLADGCIQLRDGDRPVLLVLNFLEAQEVGQSDAQRKRESRARRRDLAKAVTKRDGESRNVTEPSREVTRGHDQSHEVTPSYPSYPPVPSEPDEPRAHARKAGERDAQAEIAAELRANAVFANLDTAAIAESLIGSVIGLEASNKFTRAQYRQAIALAAHDCESGAAEGRKRQQLRYKFGDLRDGKLMRPAARAVPRTAPQGAADPAAELARITAMTAGLPKFQPPQRSR